MPILIVKYEGYRLVHHFGFDIDHRIAQMPGNLKGYAAEVKFSLDEPPIVIVRFLWTDGPDGTVRLEEFTSGQADPESSQFYKANVSSPLEALDVVLATLKDEAFWQNQFYRYWGTEGLGGNDGPKNGAPQP